MAKAVGIDLGTTNSVVSVLEGGEPTVIPNAEGARTTPSVVAFSKSGEILVGEVAKRQAITNPDRTIRSIKREMGTDHKVDIDGKKWTPQEISARILAKLKTDAEAYLGDKVTEAVITVPAYFDDAQRQATKEAGQIAGLEVLRIINEPTAAALAYGLDKDERRPDDPRLRPRWRNLRRLAARAGRRRLRGEGDARVTPTSAATTGTSGSSTSSSRRSRTQHGIDLSKDKMAMQRLKEAAEKAKMELCSTQSTTINLPFITASEQGPLHLEETLSRSEFERMTEDLLDRCRSPFEQAVKDAGISVDEIDHVILVGGSTRMPMVRELVKELTGGKDPHQGVNPDEVVSRRCRRSGRRAEGRRQGRPASRRHAAVARSRDQGQHLHSTDRAQHDDPDQAFRDLHDRRGQSAFGRDPRASG